MEFLHTRTQGISAQVTIVFLILEIPVSVDHHYDFQQQIFFRNRQATALWVAKARDKTKCFDSWYVISNVNHETSFLIHMCSDETQLSEEKSSIKDFKH